MRVYELLFVIAPTVEDGEAKSLLNQVSDLIVGRGAKLLKVDYLGRRRLAYPIQKFNEGHYAVITFEGDGSEIAEIERRLRVTDTVIRYLTVRIDEDLKRAEKIRARRAARAASRKTRAAGQPEPEFSIEELQEEVE
jgi:small subunit ribosomal protein S6